MAVIPINPGDVIVFCGDSITDQGVFRPAVAMINESITPRVSAGAIAAGGGASVARGGGAFCATVPLQPIVPIMSGTPGDTASSIASNVTGRITSHNPDAVVLFVGVNDCLTATPLANFNASLDTILADIAAFADIPVMMLSIFVLGEQWAAGPVWDNHFDPPPGNPGFTPSIVQYDNETQTAIADTTLSQAEYLDLRGPTLTLESIINAPAPGAALGVLTLDQVHPNGRGQIWISQLTVAGMAVS